MIKYINKKMILALGSLVSVLTVGAQDAAPAIPAAPAPANHDTTVWALFGVATILLICIIMLAIAFLRITEYKAKLKNGAKAALLLIGFLLSANSIFAQDAAPKAASTGFDINLIVASAIVGIELLIVLFFGLKIWQAINEVDPAKEGEKKFELPKFLENINASVALEKEKDILLDHDYDGIKELDNNLPPWWLYGFYISIIWAVGYLIYYHVAFAGPGSIEAYEMEVAQAKIDVEEYMKTAKNNVDENTVKFDATMVGEGKTIFDANCKACHGENGGSSPTGVGPNLTDEYWLHGGKINDVFKSIKYGWANKGMKAWQSDLSAIQIAQVTCYIESLKGSNPANAKEPQGTKEGGDAIATATADSTSAPATLVDSAATKK